MWGPSSARNAHKISYRGRLLLLKGWLIKVRDPSWSRIVMYQLVRLKIRVVVIKARIMLWVMLEFLGRWFFLTLVLRIPEFNLFTHTLSIFDCRRLLVISPFLFNPRQRSTRNTVIFSWMLTHTKHWRDSVLLIILIRLLVLDCKRIWWNALRIIIRASSYFRSLIELSRFGPHKEVQRFILFLLLRHILINLILPSTWTSWDLLLDW
jgi:hypothetical protein